MWVSILYSRGQHRGLQEHMAEFSEVVVNLGSYTAKCLDMLKVLKETGKV